jgi:hypothetical protein
LLPGRRKLAVAAQLALAAVVVWFAAQTISRQWEGVRATALDVEPRWSLIGASGVIVLATYALLIQIWRATLSVWGARLGFWDAARVWTVSNLGKYVPGKVWQIGAMGAMAQRRGVPPVAAVGSALVLTLVNVLAGFGVVFATGARVWEAAGASSRTVRAGAFAASALGLLVIAAPALLPRVAGLVRRVTGLEFALPNVPARAVWLAILGNVVAWICYGVAFRVFCMGVLGRRVTGDWASYIAVYTGSYLLGYLVLFAPGGLVVREAAMIAGLQRLGLATTAEAALIAVASRLWLTILEIAPGGIFVASAATRPAPPTTPPHVSRKGPTGGST